MPEIQRRECRPGSWDPLSTAELFLEFLPNRIIFLIKPIGNSEKSEPQSFHMCISFSHSLTWVVGWPHLRYALGWLRDAVMSYAVKVIWLCSGMMQLESKTHISPLLTIESPVAQWLEHPTRSRRVVSWNPIWVSDFSEFPMGSINKSHFICVYHSHIR